MPFCFVLFFPFHIKKKMCFLAWNMDSVTRRMSPKRKFSAALPSAVSIRTGVAGAADPHSLWQEGKVKGPAARPVEGPEN